MHLYDLVVIPILFTTASATGLKRPSPPTTPKTPAQEILPIYDDPLDASINVRRLNDVLPRCLGRCVRPELVRQALFTDDDLGRV